MAEIIRMPRLSDTMEEGVIVLWLKKEGDSIEPGDILAEVETDKATMELESYHEGILLHIGVKEGPVPVNGVLAVIGEAGEDYSEVLAVAKKQDAEIIEKSTESTDPAPVVAKQEENSQNIDQETPPISGDDRIKASPLAKKMAVDKGIDLHILKGTGEHGRVVKQDILDYLESGNAATTDVQTFTGSKTTEVVLSQMRKVIARRLSESKFEAPHYYVTVEIDMQNAIQARKALNVDAPPKISFNDLIVKAAALALRGHPSVNASWLGDRIRFNGNINIGVAVAIDEGLMVPVLVHADQKSLSQINIEVKALAAKARDRKLQPDEMQGNTFTISNLGMFDVDEFTAIINPPDACILAIGSIAEKPVVRNNNIEIGHIMKVTLSSDHRLVDGVTASKFLQTFRSYLENPVKMLL